MLCSAVAAFLLSDHSLIIVCVVTGEKSSFGIEEEHTSVAVVGKVLQVAREPESASGRAAAAVPAPAKEILQ